MALKGKFSLIQRAAANHAGGDNIKGLIAAARNWYKGKEDNHYATTLRYEVIMLELLESLAIVILMVPVVMAIIQGLIYLLGRLFNFISKFGQPKQRRQPSDDVRPASRQ